MTSRLEDAERNLREAIAIAERVGWTTLPITGIAYMNLASVLFDRGRFHEGEEFLAQAEPLLQSSPEPAGAIGLAHARGMLAFVQGRFPDARAAFHEGMDIAAT